MLFPESILEEDHMALPGLSPLYVALSFSWPPLPLQGLREIQMTSLSNLHAPLSWKANNLRFVAALLCNMQHQVSIQSKTNSAIKRTFNQGTLHDEPQCPLRLNGLPRSIQVEENTFDRANAYERHITNDQSYNHGCSSRPVQEDSKDSLSKRRCTLLCAGVEERESGSEAARLYTCRTAWITTWVETPMVESTHTLIGTIHFMALSTKNIQEKI